MENVLGVDSSKMNYIIIGLLLLGIVLVFRNYNKLKTIEKSLIQEVDFPSLVDSNSDSNNSEV
jgi:hypothetical protein